MAHSSGWIDYTETVTWTLSAGQGVKYLGAWVANAAGNVSVLDKHGLVFVNRIDSSQTLADGQRVQYRGNLKQGTWIAGRPDDAVRRSGHLRLEAAQRVPTRWVSQRHRIRPDRPKTWATKEPSKRAVGTCWRCRPWAPASTS